VKKEAKKRIESWFDNSDFESMTVCGSRMRFEMSLGLNGYPFKKESWMKKGQFNKVVTDEEFYSNEMDNLISELFHWSNNKDIAIKNKNK
jgi:hypothetical protein